MVKLRYDSDQGNCTLIKTEDELEGVVTSRLAEQYASLFGLPRDDIQVEIECGSTHVYVYSENSTYHTSMMNQSIYINATQQLCYPECVGCDDAEVCFGFVRVDQSTSPPSPPQNNNNTITIVVATVVPSVVLIGGIVSYIVYRSKHRHHARDKKKSKKRHKRNKKKRSKERTPLIA